MTFLSAIHKVDGVQTDQGPFGVINLSTENVALARGVILCFLKEMNIMVNEITTETDYKTVLQREKEQEENGLTGSVSDTIEKMFIKSPTDI